ncbi:DUF1963 domain-containing protein [Streptomyces vilmorinianum]|uniref:DUF1963 domain-containing protein n=1 Tax=Streptomyces vilmorinianum TaxID=3051092 RepID=UPI0010FB7A6A|nr:DUF1963 domain-containing protein [Streptomyces vilmorinianum]
MKPTTPYRPLDITIPFPELKAYARTATLLHPRPGTPTAADSSVGGPLLWPADETWPVCAEHGRVPGVRPDRHDGSALPLLALAQFYVRDVPDLGPFAPPGADLLQVLWCPFTGHDDASFNDYGPSTRLHWRRAADVTEQLSVQPGPAVVEREEYLPNPCVLFPEQVVDHPFADYLPAELVERIEAWEDALQERIGEAAPCYQYDLSLAPGWKIGGWDSWHRTDLMRVRCGACGAEMRLLLTIDSDGGARSWVPYDEAQDAWNGGRPPSPHGPTGISAARDEYRAFVCPADPSHPHRMSTQ